MNRFSYDCGHIVDHQQAGILIAEEVEWFMNKQERSLQIAKEALRAISATSESQKHIRHLVDESLKLMD